MPRIKKMSIAEKGNKTSKNNKRPIKDVVVKCKTADDKIAALRNIRNRCIKSIFD